MPSSRGAATVRRYRFPEKTIERLLRAKWWDFELSELSGLPSATSTLPDGIEELRAAKEALGRGRRRRARAIQGIPAPFRLSSDAVLVVHSGIAGLSGRAPCRGNDRAIARALEGRHPAHADYELAYCNPAASGIRRDRDQVTHRNLERNLRTKYAPATQPASTHSAAGAGVLRKRSLDPSPGHHPVPASSPYALMRDYPAISSSWRRAGMCTAVHHPEEAVAAEIYVKTPADAEAMNYARAQASRSLSCCAATCGRVIEISRNTGRSWRRRTGSSRETSRSALEDRAAAISSRKFLRPDRAA